MERGEFPPHFLYGAAKLGRHGIDVVWHRSRLGLSRPAQMVRNAWQVLTCREPFDAIYATHYRGLELVVLLRALRLLRKPIVVWHHQPVVTPRQRWREWLGRLFYRGFDRMIFFSQKLIDDSLRSPKVRPERVVLGHWGPDLDFYDRVMAQGGTTLREGFISTGKEMRDMPTLVEAFNRTGHPIDIYVNERNGNVSYRDILGRLALKPNIHLHFTDHLMPYELSLLVSKAACVAVCCQETKYTVGLTTLVEALALGLPLVCSRNPNFPIDIDQEGIGIAVPYYDADGWQQAVDYIARHPDEARQMGERARRLAERTFNDEQCAREVAEVLTAACGVR